MGLGPSMFGTHMFWIYGNQSPAQLDPALCIGCVPDFVCIGFKVFAVFVGMHRSESEK